jgi:hypothetical protein
MSEVGMDPARARLLVEARLGRRPQDMLEAAVVLEAWVGVPAQRALAAAKALMPATPAEARPSVGRLPRPSSQKGVLLEGAAFVISVIAIALWAAPLVSSLGATVVRHGLMVTLPLTIALQWGLRRRWLDHPHGLAQLADRALLLLAGACATVGLPTLVLGPSGMLAGLLTVTLTGGTILIRKRWALVYVAIILVATVPLMAGLSPLPVLAAAAGATALAVALALRTSAMPAPSSTGQWERAVAAGIIGIGLGLMLVLDRTVSWTEGTVPALALLPATFASFWGGYHLRHLEREMPRAGSGIPVIGERTRGLARPPLSVLFGALGRLMVLAGVLSVGLMALTPWLGSSARDAGVLLGFALLALATMLVSLLESMGGGAWALFAVMCAAAAEVAVRVDGADPFSGTGLVVGGAVAVVLVLPPVVVLLSRPASTLATALWIP